MYRFMISHSFSVVNQVPFVSKNLYRKHQTKYPNCAAIGQHTFLKQVKSRTLHCSCCLSKIASNYLQHLLPAISLITVPSIHHTYIRNFKKKINNFLVITI